jgi:epoxyqueuosine reductase
MCQDFEPPCPDRATRRQDSPSPGPGVSQGEADIRRRNMRSAVLAPFDQQQMPRQQVFGYPEALELIGGAQAIQVRMDAGQPRQRVDLEQGVGGTSDAPAYPQAMQQAARAAGLASTEFAIEVHHHDTGTRAGERLAERTAQHVGRSGVGQGEVQAELRWAAGSILKKPIRPEPMSPTERQQLVDDIRRWGQELGFAGIGIANLELGDDEAHLRDWLGKGFHGELGYMARHGARRTCPGLLVPGTVSCISARLDYWPAQAADAQATLANAELGYVSRYALGRDYHKVMRKRLAKLGKRIEAAIGSFGHRVFCDSAPVMEKALARNAGLGWIGKHTNLIHRDAGSYFFLGEIYLDVELPLGTPASAHCGTCSACMPACPTGAIVAPYRVDARRCISYLTIELKGAIPTEFRRAIGNRIYGCDDCQLVCPWNKFARPVADGDFSPRHGLDRSGLVELFQWSEAQFLERTAGSAIRRIGYERWLRNIAVALGNAPRSAAVITALKSRANHPSALVQEHVRWALDQQRAKSPTAAHCPTD